MLRWLFLDLDSRVRCPGITVIVARHDREKTQILGRISSRNGL